jgi:hypothetical protein
LVVLYGFSWSAFPWNGGPPQTYTHTHTHTHTHTQREREREGSVIGLLTVVAFAASLYSMPPLPEPTYMAMWISPKVFFWVRSWWL